MRERKFRKGEPFENMAQLASWLAGGGWVYWRDRPKHPSVILHMGLGTVLAAQKDGSLCRAVEAR